MAPALRAVALTSARRLLNAHLLVFDMRILHVHYLHVPTNETYPFPVSIPTIADFVTRFPNFGPRASGDGARYFGLVMRAESLMDASALTRCVQMPAVTAVAEQASALAGGAISDPDKQLVGALICTLMEHNGFRKTGRKGSVPKPGWNRGEIYVLDG